MRVVLDLKKPFVEIFKGIAFGEIKDKESSDGALVVRSGDRFEGFLSSLSNKEMYCIPNLYLDCEIVDCNVLGPELHSKSRLMISLEPSLGKSKEEARFSNALIDQRVLESPMMMNLNMKS